MDSALSCFCAAFLISKEATDPRALMLLVAGCRRRHTGCCACTNVYLSEMHLFIFEPCFSSHALGSLVVVATQLLRIHQMSHCQKCTCSFLNRVFFSFWQPACFITTKQKVTDSAGFGNTEEGGTALCPAYTRTCITCPISLALGGKWSRGRLVLVLTRVHKNQLLLASSANKECTLCENNTKVVRSFTYILPLHLVWLLFSQFWGLLWSCANLHDVLSTFASELGSARKRSKCPS